MAFATSQLHPDEPLPLVVHPDGGDLIDLVRDHAGELDAALDKHGALLFRGFGVDTAEAMGQAAEALCRDLFDENGEHAHDAVAKNVYTPVEYSSSSKLLWHTENSFNHRWPSRLLFAAAVPAASGGQTPLVDNRRLWRALDPAVREAFATAGVTYARSYGTGVGLDWQQIFGTDDKEQIEAHLAENLFEWEWLQGGGLRTRSHRPAAVRHPATGQPTWFAQVAHWHPSCLDSDTREALEILFGEDDLPRDCFLGSAERISDEWMASILTAYESLEVVFDWEKGDLLLVDNLSVSHARQPYTGERKLLVALGNMMSFAEVEPVL
ncbi:TauD/TfdA family dioxygenase [Streptomyces sp. SID13031]|uniref:TauD/TfdA family dioxygenase n=1 Tax=Streptomyces sp. SID13031 TaxID=2706046 RepID=UPI0013CA3508|nr:TauD/TfdA family dioxygenase [Streptomyces sp. SID13031]NEA32501.1 TauD/TfdA family dioxygenase [Streptomyces sp. SID13031]